MFKRKLCLMVLFPVTAALMHPLRAAAQTPAASQSAKQVTPIAGFDKRFVDGLADPCVSFVQYACGNYTKLYPIPPDQTAYGVTTMVFEHNELVLHTLLEKVAADSPGLTANEQKIGNYYASCMDTSAIQSQGLKPLAPELDRIAALTDKKQLSGLLAHYQMTNVNAFFAYGEQQDFKDATKQIAVVDQGGLGLPERDYYLRTGPLADMTRQEYVQHVTNMLKLLGEPEAQAVSDAAKVMQLETSLAKISMDITSQRDPNNVYHPMPVAKLVELTPAIDWKQLFEQTGTPSITTVNVTNLDFLKGLNTLLDSSDLDTIKAYLRWQLIHSMPSYALPEALDVEAFDFFGHKLRGQPVQRDRWKRCVQATDRVLGDALGQVYVAEEFPPTSKAATLQMVHDIETAMDKDIDSLEWMGPATKAKAKEKLHLVRIRSAIRITGGTTRS